MLYIYMHLIKIWHIHKALVHAVTKQLALTTHDRAMANTACSRKQKEITGYTRSSLHTVNTGGVTRVGVTRGGNWRCHPIFSWIKWQPFLLSLSLLLISLGCHPCGGCHHGLFLPVRPRLSTVLSKFSHNFFSFGCHPPRWCHPERSASPPPTVMPLVNTTRTKHSDNSVCNKLV